MIAIVFASLTSLIRFSLPLQVRKHFIVQLIFELPKFPPPIAWIPIIILLLGIGEKAAWAVVAIGAYPSLSTTLFDSVLSFPKSITLFSQTLQINSLQKAYHIYFKGLLPQLMTGLRLSFNMGWMCIVAAEMISGDSGLGYLIQLHRLDLNYSLVLFDIFLIGLVGFLFNLSLKKLEQRLCPWNQHNTEKKYA